MDKKIYLYDAWENLENDNLRFKYDYLDIDITKKLFVFNKNFI